MNVLRKMCEVVTVKGGGREDPALRTVARWGWGGGKSCRGIRMIGRVGEGPDGSGVRKQGPSQVSKQAMANSIECCTGLKMKNSGDSIEGLTVTGMGDLLSR